ncbi:MAG: T9SS type A sorting domain-containing protein, partial [bacterium]
MELRDAFEIAELCPNVTEIWVAEGTYKPTNDTTRAASFQLPDSLAIYGGFAGWETVLSQRDWATNVTVLSGDIGIVDDDLDNSYHVVTTSGTDSMTVLDGFMITKGRADGAGTDGYGGGMYCLNASPTVVNVVFLENYASEGGGGMCNEGSGPLGEGSSPIVANVVFSGNYSSWIGGGMCNYYNSSPTLVNVTFSGNYAFNAGRGIYNGDNSNPKITNTILWGDTGSVGAKEINGDGSNAIISYSLIEGSFIGGINWDLSLGTDGGNNIDTDPLFIGAPANLRLGMGSPAIDAGTDTAFALPATDLDGNPRIALGKVDMGAYEWDNCPSGTVLYVDADANSGGSGDSWEDAYNELRDALVAAALRCSNVTEIWVAEGTYMPTNDTTRAASFELQDSLEIYGGFDGTEILRSERDWVTNVTILSGDIGVPAESSDNSYHVVVENDCDSTAVLDGFTITAGRADGASGNDDGGGIVADGGSPKFANLVISNNYALDMGGGMYNASAASRLSNVTFEGNEGDDGGGMIIRYAGSDGARLVDVRFIDNAAATSGGGLQVTTASPMLENVTFTGNQAPWGGGMRASYGASPTIANALFLNNVAGSGGGGGGIFNSNDGVPVLTNVTFHGNSGGVGGGIYAYTGSPVLVNVIMWGDSAVTSGDEIYNYDGASTNISYSLIEGCGGSGGWDASVGTDGGNNIDTDPLFVSEFLQDFRLHDDSPAVDAGDSTAVGLPDTDINGNPRIQGLTVDMGAYEGGVVINYEYALIDSIMDVPDDQGGWVYIRFNRSMYDDTLETEYPIERYDIHRRIDNPLLAAEIMEHGEQLTGEVLATLPDGKSVKLSTRNGDEGSCCIRYNDMYYFLNSEQSLAAPPGLWADIGTVSAAQQAQYIALSPTLGDSISEPPLWSVYYISAHSTTPAVYFDSPPDSGYSVDNIAPGVPLGFAVAYNTGSGNQLTWDPSPEPDFQYYRIYRGDSEDFIPAPGNLVHETATEGWSDPEYDGWDVHYKITALDYVGNESDAASPESTTGDDVPLIPKAFALYQNVPNPFNPTTTIRFDLPRAVHVKLSIYNVKGELIATLVDQHMTEGRKEVSWTAKDNRGRAVSSGIYFYRLVAGDFVQTKKMVLLR